VNQQDLGPLEAWQIRKFPRELRQAVVVAAKERHLSPGELVTGILPKCGQRRLHDITGSGERASAQSTTWRNWPKRPSVWPTWLIACRRDCARICSERCGKQRAPPSTTGAAAESARGTGPACDRR
jgi:hypothetical protein